MFTPSLVAIVDIELLHLDQPRLDVITHRRGAPVRGLRNIDDWSSFYRPKLSGHKGGQNETFKTVERRPVTFDLGTRDRAFERVDQRDGNLSRIQQLISSR